MRLALCAGSFEKELTEGTAVMEDLFRMSSRTGMTAVEVRNDLIADGTGFADWTRLAGDYKLELIYSFKMWPLHTDLARMGGQEKLFRQALEETVLLRANVLKIGFGEIAGPAQWSRAHTSMIREWMRAAEACGVTVCLENGKQKPGLIRDLLKAVDHPYLKTTFDTGNYRTMAGVSPVDAARMLAHRVGYVHLKDETPDGQSTWLGNGEIPFDQVVQILVSHGYEGYWCLEFPMSIGGIREIEESIAHISA